MGVCPICFEGLKSPACCVPCGHVFCKVCISRWSAYNNRSLEEVLYHYSPQRSRSCPQCRTDIHSIQRIRFDVDEIPGTFYTCCLIFIIWIYFIISDRDIRTFIIKMHVFNHFCTTANPILSIFFNQVIYYILKAVMNPKLILGKQMMITAQF